MSDFAGLLAGQSPLYRPADEPSLIAALHAALQDFSQAQSLQQASLFLLDASGRTLVCLASSHPETHPTALYPFTPGQGLIANALQTRIPQVYPDAAHQSPIPPDPQTGSVYIVPFQLETLQIGALVLRREVGVAYNQAETALAAVLAATLALTIDYAQLQQRLNLQENELLSRANQVDALQIALDRATLRKGEFLASSAHELRTPLNAILGFSEILKDELVVDLSDTDRHHALESIHTAGQHLLKLVNELIDMDKLDAGRMELTPEPTSLTALLKEVSTILAPLTAPAKLQIISAIHPPSLVLLVDKYRFKQVLYNLIGNAIKFSPENGKITISASANTEQATIKISDQGPGIPRSAAEMIFDEFYQIDPAHAKTGSGLGLPLSRRLVKLHNGTLEVANTSSPGATFVITIPALVPPWTNLAGTKTAHFNARHAPVATSPRSPSPTSR